MRFMNSKSTSRDAELDEEIRAHLAMAIADRMARGESYEQAAAAARREFGNLGHVKEVTRETWGSLWLERLRQDLVVTFRALRRAPAFAVAALVVLALGIGLNTAISRSSTRFCCDRCRSMIPADSI